MNLYGMVGNDALNIVDLLGLENCFCPQLRKALERARLAKAGYPGSPIPAGWEKVDAFKEFGIPEQLFHNVSSGYDATLFRNPSSGEYVVSFAGTNEVKDFTEANIPQNFALNSDQYARATRLGNILGREVPDVDFTGHSLGGALASAAFANSSSRGRGYIFNSAGLNRKTLDRYGGTYDEMSAKTEHWNYPTDPLTMAQAKYPNLVYPAAGEWIGVNFVDGADSILQKHSIDTMIQSLEEEMRKLGCK